MLSPIYCIKDNKSGFLTPTVDQNDATATRNFEHALMNMNTVLGTHPADFDLYKIGTFDTDTGVLTRLNTPELICGGFVVGADMEIRQGKKKGARNV